MLARRADTLPFTTTTHKAASSPRSSRPRPADTDRAPPPASCRASVLSDSFARPIAARKGSRACSARRTAHTRPPRPPPPADSHRRRPRPPAAPPAARRHHRPPRPSWRAGQAGAKPPAPRKARTCLRHSVKRPSPPRGARAPYPRGAAHTGAQYGNTEERAHAGRPGGPSQPPQPPHVPLSYRTYSTVRYFEVMGHS